MEKVEILGWIHYIEGEYLIPEDKCGKWMYFFNGIGLVSKICEDAVKKKIVNHVKHTDDESGVACFYLNCDDIEAHKRVLSYFMEKKLIQKTKDGRYYNISFKLDKQTQRGEYKDSFHAEIKLSDFIDLYTGEWIV